jgi:hypothetical protein
MRREALVLFAVALISLGLCGTAYSSWRERLRVRATVTTGRWRACVRIGVTLDGAYTDPVTGASLDYPNRTHVALGSNFSTRFKMTYTVRNCRSTLLTGVVVTDAIMDSLAPTEWSVSAGSVAWRNQTNGSTRDGSQGGLNELRWDVGDLEPGGSAVLVCWLVTLPDERGLYAPSMGENRSMETFAVNLGAAVRASSTFSRLSARTRGITISIADDGRREGPVKIEKGLPSSTPWAEGRYP